MTKLALAVQRFGETLRDTLKRLRESGETDTEYFRRILHIYAELGAVIYLMEGAGELDPETAENIRKTLEPEFRRTVAANP